MRARRTCRMLRPLIRYLTGISTPSANTAWSGDSRRSRRGPASPKRRARENRRRNQAGSDEITDVDTARAPLRLLCCGVRQCEHITRHTCIVDAAVVSSEIGRRAGYRRRRYQRNARRTLDCDETGLRHFDGGRRRLKALDRQTAGRVRCQADINCRQRAWRRIEPATCQLLGVSPIVWNCFIVVLIGSLVGNTLSDRKHLSNDQWRGTTGHLSEHGIPRVTAPNSSCAQRRFVGR